MGLALGLLAMALVGDDGAASARAAAPISYRVTVLEMGGPRWRELLYFRLNPAGRQGAATVWTADAEVGEALRKRARRVVIDPQLLVNPGAEATVRCGEDRSYVVGLKRHADGPVHCASAVAFEPDVETLHDGVCATLSGRCEPAGVRTRLELEQNEFLAFHAVPLSEAVEGKDGRGATMITAQVQVPEVATSRVEGEWLVPGHGLLVVSLGAKTYPGAKEKGEPEVRERLVLVQAEPAPAPQAKAPWRPAPAPLAVAPPMPRPAPAPMPPAAMPIPTAPAADPMAHFIPMPPEPESEIRTPVLLAPPYSAAVAQNGPEIPRPLPTAMPPMPSRTLPPAIAPDGTTVALPALPDRSVQAAGYESAEPRPSPQGRPFPGKPAMGTCCEAPHAPAGEPPGGFPTLPGLNTSDVGPDRMDPFPNRSYPGILVPVDSPIAPPAACGRPSPKAEGGCDSERGCSSCNAPAAQAWPLTLREAIRIGLRNAEAVRVVAERPAPDLPPGGFVPAGGPAADRASIVIARPNDDVTDGRFKAEVMALVRSIEQQYWALAQQQVRLWASKAAVEMGEQVLGREKAKHETGAGEPANLAEAQEQLARLRLRLVSDTADAITAERQLRNILGLPPVDHRRIMPTTVPVEAAVAYDWESCLAEMAVAHPDLARWREAVRADEKRLCESCSPTPHAATPLNCTSASGRPCESCSPMALAWPLDGFAPFRVPLAAACLDRERACERQALHQATHQLARFFLELDANYKQFKAAGRLKAAAQQRLEAQRACYEDGTITMDRYLDAVQRWADAVAQEADFKGRYNTSITGLEEAKGTLLDFDHIAIARAPRRHATAETYTDDQLVAAGHYNYMRPYPGGPLHYCGHGDAAAAECRGPEACDRCEDAAGACEKDRVKAPLSLDVRINGELATDLRDVREVCRREGLPTDTVEIKVLVNGMCVLDMEETRAEAPRPDAIGVLAPACDPEVRACAHACRGGDCEEHVKFGLCLNPATKIGAWGEWTRERPFHLRLPMLHGLFGLDIVAHSPSARGHGCDRRP
jgi:hypothetical protein